VDPVEVAYIRERDAQSAETWFKLPALGACGRAFIDRRFLLQQIDALVAPKQMPPWAVLLLECRDALPAITLAAAKLYGIDLKLAERIEAMLEPWRVTDGGPGRYPPPVRPGMTSDE
jgi:hypothetical protein